MWNLTQFQVLGKDVIACDINEFPSSAVTVFFHFLQKSDFEKVRYIYIYIIFQEKTMILYSESPIYFEVMPAVVA